MRIRLTLALAFLFAVGAPALTAQSPDCTYDQCALRVYYSPAGAALVRGVDQIVLNGLGFWATPDVVRAFSPNRLSQDLANSYRERHNISTILTGVGAVSLFVGLIATDGDIKLDFSGPSLLELGGLAAIAIGGRVALSAQDQLSRAIWEYNRALAR